MVTIYQLLEVEENASIEEIKNKYASLTQEFSDNSGLTPEEIKQNGIILNKLKMAYDILTDNEQRAKYDKMLADKRAEELLKGVKGSLETVKVSKEEIAQNVKQEVYNEVKQTEAQVHARTQTQAQPQVKQAPVRPVIPYDNEDEPPTAPGELTRDEQIRIQQAAQREFQEKLQKAQAAEEAYKKAYNQAYDNYVKNMNGTTGRKWTLKKIGIILAVIVVVILIGCIMWLIPPVRRMLINLYEENDIVHMLVNLIVGIVKAFRI